MDNKVSFTDQFLDALSDYGKGTCFIGGLSVGVIVGIILSSLFGFKGILILVGIYFIYRYFKNKDKK